MHLQKSHATRNQAQDDATSGRSALQLRFLHMAEQEVHQCAEPKAEAVQACVELPAASITVLS